MSYDLKDYDPVESRIKKFYLEHPDGRIITVLMNSDPENKAIFKAELYLADRLVATGWAYEERDTEKAISKFGKEYEEVNYSCWIENCETSSIGRALANYNYAGNKRPSLEEMKKVSAWQGNKKPETKAVNTQQDKKENTSYFSKIVSYVNNALTLSVENKANIMADIRKIKDDEKALEEYHKTLRGEQNGKQSNT